MKYDSLPHYWVNHLGFQLRKALEAAFSSRGHHVTGEEWALLLILNTHETLSPRELSQRTLRDPTTVSRLIDRMERKGLVDRIRTREDRRIVDITMTAAGQVLFADLFQIAQALIHCSLEGIAPDDEERVVRVLKQMSENLSTAEGLHNV